MQTGDRVLTQRGVGFSVSLLLHAGVAALLFYGVTRETAIQQAFHQVDSPVFTVRLIPATASAVAVQPEAQSQQHPPLSVPVADKPELVVARPKPHPPSKPHPQARQPVNTTPARPDAERPLRKTAPQAKRPEDTVARRAERVTQEKGTSQAASPDAGVRGNAPQTVNAHASEGEKQAYLARVRAAVEKNKVYPSRTRRMKIQGSVNVEITIDAQGNVTAARVFASSGDASLDEAALDTARKAQSSGPPPPGLGRTIVMQIDFRLTKR